jgi:hypothetical protein
MREEGVNSPHALTQTRIPMKTYAMITFILYSIAGTTFIMSQTKTAPQQELKQEAKKETKQDAKTAAKQEPKQESITSEFRDLNANGIDDTKETTGSDPKEKKTRKHVKFIDSDGDGICDGRASGAGLKLRMHGENGKHLQKGKK